MFSIEVMVEEHENISRMLKVVRKVCFNIMNGAEIPYDDFEKIVDFVKNYADEHHHGKEEKILFDKMQEHLGALGNKLITHGMLVEHDFGRLYMHELREALARVKAGDEESKLDVIANAISYTHLFRRIRVICSVETGKSICWHRGRTGWQEGKRRSGFIILQVAIFFILMSS